MMFRNREEAGRLLAQALAEYQGRPDLVVLGLPRGGVPVARIVADFVDHFDVRRERCWIAERNDQAVGCVFLVKHPDSPEALADYQSAYQAKPLPGFLFNIASDVDTYGARSVATESRAICF